MEKLNESIKYTIDKKSYQISNLEESFLNESIEDIKNYLNGIDTLSGVILGFGNLSTWYHWNFIYKFLDKNKVDYNLLTKSTYFVLETNNLRFFLGKKVETYKSAISFTDSIKHLAQILYLGWEEKAVQYGQLLIKMLYGKQYTGGRVFPLHPWFMLELFCKWQHIELDKEQLRYPDDLEVYKEALEYWDTKDATQLSIIIDKLTEFHIQQSNENVVTDEYGNEFSPEFTSADYFIFPVEILMWLSIRRIWGLPEYEPSSQNELMQLEINKLPRAIFPFPKDELVEQCKAKLLKENPDINFELKF